MARLRTIVRSQTTILAFGAPRSQQFFCQANSPYNPIALAFQQRPANHFKPILGRDHVIVEKQDDLAMRLSQRGIESMALPLRPS